ncbi:hypothetical protein C6P40_003478 [Pichia californica]|uniref:Cullin family profile domain-containing protein n=1 Tax=Pichia californica TaxID=460514 RepID=A0A9P7BEJ2_9ASCO|nr:hypothetical protein C6P42_000215 [[Candida] californica]KAG0686719.1 hypothetical protein C6P40_003478 [[Candida] californica]
MDFVSNIEFIEPNSDVFNDIFNNEDLSKKKQKLNSSSPTIDNTDSDKYYQLNNHSLEEDYLKNREESNLLIRSTISYLSQDFDILSNDLLKTHEYAQRLSRIGKSKMINQYIELNIDRIKNNIKELIINSFNSFNNNNSNEFFTEFPLCNFFEIAYTDFKLINIALYPIFNGIRCSFTGNKYDRIRMDKPSSNIALSSNGYPITELEGEFCRQLILLYGITPIDQLYGKNENSKLIDLSISRLCKSLKSLYLKEINDDNKIELEIYKISNFFILGNKLKSCGANIDIDNIFFKCHIYVLKSIKNKLFTKDHYDSIFDDIKYIENKIILRIISTIKFNKNFKNIIHFNDKNIISLIFNDNIEFFNNIIIRFYHSLFEYFENKDELNDINKEFKLKERLNILIELDNKFKNEFKNEFSLIENGAKELVNEFFNSIDLINEEKFKDISKLFDKLILFISKINSIYSIFKIKEPIKQFKIQLIKYWEKFNKNFEDHYSHYIDHKLKLIVKSKDRNKLEIEIKKLSKNLEIIFPYIEFNENFKKMYKIQFLQRMLNSIYESNFTLFTNICDCENEMCKKLDNLFKISNNFNNLSFLKILKDIKKSRLNFIEFKKFKNNNKISIIGLPNNLKFIKNNYLPFNYDKNYNNNEKNLKNSYLKLPSNIKSDIKDFKNFLKLNENSNDKLKDSKLLLELNYSYSRMLIDFTLNDGTICHLDCNFYHGMILSLFNEFNILNENEIAKKLNLLLNITIKYLNNLKSSKCPILKNIENDWMIDENFKITDKIKRANNTIVI